MNISGVARLWISLFILMMNGGVTMVQAKSPIAYDADMAKEICTSLPLENVEGLWLYPEDKVTVLILRNNEDISGNLPAYNISVVETADASLRPGDLIGTLEATTDENTFKIHLSTEKHNDLLLKPKSCIATLSKDGDTFTFKRQKSPFKGRLNFNFSRLLPGFWKVISAGVYSPTGTSKVEAPVGMVKLYPSYDGNGSSRRKVRYL
ncbi:MAG: hypothetical protein J1F16_05245 [Muribaculaceae bacterium]|nr:hypothetical protein [Muribaculaceae bacterium]